MKPDGTKAKVLVIGDIILDHDVYLKTVRESPEGGGIPIVQRTGADLRLGGAGAVAVMAAALGADAWLSGILGDAGSEEMRDGLATALENSGVDITGIPTECRNSTIKTRYFMDGTQTLREDCESTSPIPTTIVQQLKDAWPLADVVLIADYGKGVVTPLLMDFVRARFHDVPVIVDPARGADWERYRNVSCICPNRAESSEMVIRKAIPRVLQKMDTNGIIFRDQTPEVSDAWHFPSTCPPSELVDVCGAGDMVLAALGVFVAEGRSWVESARLANITAGLKCRQHGATPVTREVVEDADKVEKSKKAIREERESAVA